MMPSPSLKQGPKNPMDVFKDMFICMIDFEPLHQPKLLQCGHSFCKNCLEQLLLSQRRSSRDLLDVDEATDRIRCPVCSTFTKVPLDGIDGLSNNFMLEKLKDCVQELEEQHQTDATGRVGSGPHRKDPPPLFPAHETKLCEMSVDCKVRYEPAQFRCHDCAKNCCKDCFDKHNKILSFHKTVSLSSDTANLLQCPEHKEEYIRFYCLDCAVSMCTFCRVHVEHDANHSIVEIMDKDSIIEERQNIREHIEGVKTTLGYVNSLSNKLQDLRKQLYDMYATCEDEMQRAFHNLLGDIQRTWARFETERQASKCATEKLIDTAQEEINWHVTNCTSLLSFIDRLLSNKESFQPLTLFRDLKARMLAAAQNMPALEVLVPDLHVAHFCSQDLSAMHFGHIEDVLMQPVYSSEQVEISPVPGVHQKRETHIGGFFLPEEYQNETQVKVPDTTRVTSRDTEQSKSVFYDDGGGVFLEEDPTETVVPQVFVFPEVGSGVPLSRHEPARWSGISAADSELQLSEPPSPGLRARGSYFYSSGPADYQTFRRCVSNISLANRRYEDKPPPSAKLPGGESKSKWQKGKKTFLEKLKKKLSVSSPKDTNGKKEKRTRTSSSSTMPLKSPPITGTPDLGEGELLWQISCGTNVQASAFSFPSDVAISSATGEVFVVDHLQNRIAVLENGVLRRTIRPQLLPNFSPWGVAVSSAGYVFCTDIHNKCVQVFTWQGDHLTSWNSPEDHAPYGITSSQDGKHIVVTSASQQCPPSNIIVSTYTIEGKFIHSFRCTYGGDPGELKDPRYIIVSGESVIYTSDRDTGRINMYSTLGNHKGHFSRLLGCPAGICPGPNNEILVADRGANNRIVRFSSSGKLIGDLKLKCTDSITWPQGMSSCEYKDHMLLAITEYLENSKVTLSIYKFSRNSLV